MVRDFIHGASFIWKGYRHFYEDREAWKYAMVPLIIAILIYALVLGFIAYGCGFATNRTMMMLPEFPGWLVWLHSCLYGIIWLILFLITMTAAMALFGSLYEILSGLFFDSLVAYCEQKFYGRAPTAETFGQMARFCWDSCIWSLKGIVALLLLGIASIFLPIAGPILLCWGMGYFFGISCLMSPNYYRRRSFFQLQQLVKANYWRVVGFGICAYLLLLIPLANIILLPAFFVGGDLLYNEGLIHQIRCQNI